MDTLYTATQIVVFQSGNYTLLILQTSEFMFKTGLHEAFLYVQHFNPSSPSERLLSDGRSHYVGAIDKMTTYLQANITYILVETFIDYDSELELEVVIFGRNEAVFYQISSSNIYYNSFLCCNFNLFIY